MKRRLLLFCTMMSLARCAVIGSEVYQNAVDRVAYERDPGVACEALKNASEQPLARPTSEQQTELDRVCWMAYEQTAFIEKLKGDIDMPALLALQTAQDREPVTPYPGTSLDKVPVTTRVRALARARFFELLASSTSAGELKMMKAEAHDDEIMEAIDKRLEDFAVMAEIKKKLKEVEAEVERQKVEQAALEAQKKEDARGQSDLDRQILDAALPKVESVRSFLRTRQPCIVALPFNVENERTPNAIYCIWDGVANPGTMNEREGCFLGKYDLLHGRYSRIYPYSGLIGRNQPQGRCTKKIVKDILTKYPVGDWLQVGNESRSILFIWLDADKTKTVLYDKWKVITPKLLSEIRLERP